VKTVLVCGGRDYVDEVRLFEVLDNLLLEVDEIQIVNGAARGADLLSSKWCRARGGNPIECRPEWEVYGRGAGIRRNQQMLDDHNIDIVVAFPGGRGTADMTYRAADAGIEVRFVD